MSELSVHCLQSCIIIVLLVSSTEPSRRSCDVCVNRHFSVTASHSLIYLANYKPLNYLERSLTNVKEKELVVKHGEGESQGTESKRTLKDEKTTGRKNS